MDLNTFFLGVIAFCAVVITVFLIVFLLGILRVLSSTNEKLAVVTFELSQILPSLRKSVKNIESVTSLLGIFNLFSSKSKKE